MDDYLASDAVKEKQWGISLPDAIMRGRQGRKAFDGWTIVFTQAAKNSVGSSGYKELKELASMAGAKHVSAALPKKAPDELSETLVVAGSNDPARGKLRPGWKCFSHEVIGISILRGKVDLSSNEFLVPISENEEEQRRGRKRQRRQ